jgi:hypothetical protein
MRPKHFIVGLIAIVVLVLVIRRKRAQAATSHTFFGGLTEQAKTDIMLHPTARSGRGHF